MKNKRGRLLKNKESTIYRAFQNWLTGSNLRELSTFFNIPHQTLSYNFKKYFGPNYTKLRNNHGIIPIIQEHLSNTRLTPKQRSIIQNWLEEQIKELLINDLKNTDTRLLTSREENKLTFAECSHSEKDWREIL